MTGIDLCICWQFDGTTPIEGLNRLAALGYEGIELWPDALHAFPLADWRNALAATGLKLLQLCPYFNFMEGQPKIDASYAQLIEYLDVARVTGCKRIRVFTGPPWGEGVVGAKQATQTQWEDATRSLRAFCDVAAIDGVELCLECHEGSLMEDSSNTLRLIHAVDRSNLTVNLQIPFKGESWEYSVAQLGAYTSHLHIHNWTDGFGAGDLTFLSTGKFDWSPVLQTLTGRHCRHVTVSLEHITHMGRHDPWETAEVDIVKLRELSADL